MDQLATIPATASRGDVFVPMTPGILAGYVVEQVVIAGWMALFAILGWVQLSTPTHTAP